MLKQSLYHTVQRYRTLQTHKIFALPIVILMPHSACNCRCIMCDIWKDNKNLKQLTEKDIESLLSSFKKFSTQEVVMSGGEALLNANFFRFSWPIKWRAWLVVNFRLLAPRRFCNCQRSGGTSFGSPARTHRRPMAAMATPTRSHRISTNWQPKAPAIPTHFPSIRFARRRGLRSSRGCIRPRSGAITCDRWLFRRRK